ncbi:threonine synthase [Geomicrobium sp. JCM 19037]|uniref:threonine synthase n=1 Tax=Geomicrobium sp. JCM 19037 TaxID=1460634 RepID=UPI00045F3E75|nr:threonine synthase [Geomicrobium sp. JCM 19037]GAK02684.1 threonine synthase [Geomicrobium sp. JCM 19037]
MKLQCVDCKNTYSMDDFQYQCECGGLFDIVHNFKGVDTEKLKHTFQERLAERMTPLASGVWRYKELIFPEVQEEHMVTKYEGNTGLYQSAQVRTYTGMKENVLLKAQSENPSGSFKDNGMAVAVSHGRSLGYNKFTCTSTGNTSSSLAMYSSMAGCKSYVFVPNKNISMNKVMQTIAYGAKVFSTEGKYDEGIEFLQQYSEELGLYVCNSINPFRIEGQKSIVFEIAQYLNWKLPDWIVVPGGALSNSTALGKGLQDLYELGFIDKLPRVAIVQAEGASPFHRMMATGSPYEPEREPNTVASALNIGNPPSWKKAARVLKETDGVTVAVTDEEILNAKAVIDQSGIGCEPASAATVAGLKKLVDNQTIDKEEQALCILTGNMLKDTDVLKKYHTEQHVFSNPIVETLLTKEEIAAEL